MSKVEKIDWEPVEDSSNVHGLYHHEPHKVICVRFHSGAMYTYMGGDHELYMNLKSAPSVGKYLNRVVKALPYTRHESEAALLEYLNIGK